MGVSIWEGNKAERVAAALERMAVQSGSANVVQSLITDYGAKKALIVYVKMLIEADSDITLNDAVTSFYENAVQYKNYVSQFAKFSSSSSYIGTKLYDNADMSCTPSTNTTAGTDDYADTPMFAIHYVNYRHDGTTPTITAIHNVSSDFTFRPTTPGTYVGVLQMGAWVRKYTYGSYKYSCYADYQVSADYEPLPECVDADDNSFRPWMIHAKYVAGMMTYNSTNYLTCRSGDDPICYNPYAADSYTASISHDGQIALWRRADTYLGNSAYYNSGECLCDIAFREWMFEIKYAVLGNSATIAGCHTFNTSKTLQNVSDETTDTFYVTAGDGSYFIEGCTVSVSTVATSRQASTHGDCVFHARVKSITSGTTYDTIVLDTEGTTDSSTTYYIYPEPWYSGACDNVLGNDGSPTSYTSGKEPGMIQGIEFMTGQWEVLADTVLQLVSGADELVVYGNRLAANLASGGVGTDAYTLDEGVPVYSSAGWRYIEETGTTPDSAIVPTATGSASSSTGYQAACYTEVNTNSGYREWPASGPLNNGGVAGVPALHGNYGLGSAAWVVAARASGTGGNRGEWGA